MESDKLAHFKNRLQRFWRDSYCRSEHQDGCLSPTVCSSTASLKTHDYLILCGGIGKWAIDDLYREPCERVVQTVLKPWQICRWKSFHHLHNAQRWKRTLCKLWNFFRQYALHFFWIINGSKCSTWHQIFNLDELDVELWTVQPTFNLSHPKQSTPRSQSRRTLLEFASSFIKETKKLLWYCWHLWNMEVSWIGERIWRTRFSFSMEVRNVRGSLGRHGMASWCTAWIRIWWLWCYHGPSSCLFGMHWLPLRMDSSLELGEGVSTGEFKYSLYSWIAELVNLESLKTEEQLVSPKMQRFILCGWLVGLKHLISLHLVVGTRTCGITILMAENNIKHPRDLEAFGGMEGMGRVPMTLPSHERLLTMGATNCVITFSIATINGLKLRTKRLDEGKKSCTRFFGWNIMTMMSYIMM